jgi:hypothetical protein
MDSPPEFSFLSLVEDVDRYEIQNVGAIPPSGWSGDTGCSRFSQIDKEREWERRT